MADTLVSVLADTSGITQYVDMAFLIFFIVIIVGLVGGFFYGLLHGWRYGTYRLIAYAALITLALCLLRPEANFVGNLDLSGLGVTIPAIGDSGTATPLTSLYETGTEVMKQLLVSYGASGTETAIINYAFALVQSLVMLIMIFVDGLLLSTLGQFFIWLLWKVAFCHIVKPKVRKIKTKRWISAGENLLVCLVVSGMMLTPFTSLLNAVNANYDSSNTETGNSTLDTVNSVMQSYDKSLFAQIFFNWTQGDGNMTFDTAMVDFLTTGDYDGVEASVTSLITSVADLGSTVVNSGLLNSIGSSDFKWTSILTSTTIPSLLYSISASDLGQNLLPLAVNLALSFDSVKNVLGDSTVSYLTSSDSKIDWAEELSNLATVYGNIVDSGVLAAVIDPEGNLSFDASDIVSLFTDQSSNTYGALHAALKNLDESKVISRVLSGFIYSYVSNEENADDGDPATIQLIDFMPKGSDGKVDATAISNTDWMGEVSSLFDSLYKIIQIAPDAISGILTSVLPSSESTSSRKARAIDVKNADEGSSSSEGSGEEETTSSSVDWLSVVGELAGYTDNLLEVVVGPSDQYGNLVGLSEDGTYSNGCLLDLQVVQNFLPSFVPFMQASINSYLTGQGVSELDLSSVSTALNNTDAATQLINYKTEISHILSIVSTIASSSAGVAFISDYASMPGINFDPDGKLRSIDSDLISTLSKAVSKMDSSLIISKALPSLLSGALSSLKTTLESYGISNIDFDVENLGGQIAYLLKTFGDCSSLFSTLTGETSDPTMILDSITSNREAFAKILDLFINSEILNPSTGGTANENFYLFLNQAFSLAGLDFSIDPDDPKFSGLQLANSTDSSGNFLRDSNGDAILDGETGSMLHVFEVIAESGVISQLSSLGEGTSSTEAANILGSVDIEGLFTAIGESKIISSAAGALMDTYFSTMLETKSLCIVPEATNQMTSSATGTITITVADQTYYCVYAGGTYGSTDPDVVVKLLANYLGTGAGTYVFTGLTPNTDYDVVTFDVMTTISFSNITDWAAEGKTLQALIDVATSGLDIANLDFLSADPSTIKKLITCLASSNIFNKINADGTSDYTFTEYLYRKIIASFDADTLKYFTDDVDISGLSSSSTLSEKEGYTTILHSDFSQLDTVDKWTADGGEADKFAAVIADILQVDGGLSALSSLTSSSVGTICALLTDLNESDSIGRVVIFNALKTAFSTIGGDSIDFSNGNYAYFIADTTSKADRTAEIARLTSIIKAVFDETYGIIGSDGSIDTTKIKIGTVSVEYLLAPLLDGFAQSKVFSTFHNSDPLVVHDADHLTVLESAMKMIIKSSGAYSNDFSTNELLNSAHSTMTLSKMLLDISERDGWGDSSDSGSEIGILITLIEKIQGSSFIDASGNFSTEFLNDTGAYFTGSPSQIQAKKDELVDILTAINKSELLYRVLPEKIDTALSSMSLGDFSAAISSTNVYYMEYTDGAEKDYKPFYQSGSYDEIANLVNILEASSSLSSVDMTDLTTLDAETVSQLLVEMDDSALFNTVATGKTLSCFEEVIKIIYGSDTIKSYLYCADSPKDIAAAAASTYDSADTKASYLSSSMLNLSVNASHEVVAPTGLSDQDAMLYNTKADGSSLYDLLSTFKDPAISSMIAGGTFDYDKLTGSQITQILKAMNDCDLFYDCAPNAIHEILSSGSFSITDIELGTANVFYSYGTSSYTNRIDDDELEQIGVVFSLIKANQSTLNSMSDIGAIEPSLFREILREMSQSKIFHEAGAVDSGAGLLTSDLTVFEQIMYKLYKQSGLAEQAYSAYYDYYDYPGASGYLQKLHDRIKSFSNNTLGTSHDGDWSAEIDALTTDDYGVNGLIAYIKSSGLVSGGTLNIGTSSLKSQKPEVIGDLLSCLNEIDIGADILPYSMRSLIGEDGFKLNSFADDSFTYTPNATSWTSQVGQGVISITIESASEPTLYIAKTSSEVLSTSSTAVTTSSTASPYVYDVSGLPGYQYLAVSTSNITSVIYKYDSNNFTISQAEFAATDLEAIDEILLCLWDSGSNSYFSFDDTTGLQQFFNDGHSVEGALNFFAHSHIYNSAWYSYDGIINSSSASEQNYKSRDIAMDHFLTYKFSGGGLSGKVTLGANFGPKTLSAHEKMGVISGIFEDPDYSSSTEAAWLDANVVNAGLVQSGIDQEATLTFQGMLYIFFVGRDTFSTLFDSLGDTLAASSKFGSHIVAGQMTSIANYGWDTLVTGICPVDLHGEDLTSGVIFGSLTQAEALPDLYGAVSEQRYSLANLFGASGVMNPNQAVAKLNYAGGSLYKNGSDYTSAEITIAHDSISALTNLYNSGYVDVYYAAAIYNYMRLHTYYNIKSLTLFTDFPNPRGNGYLNSTTENTAFTYPTIAALVV